MRRPPPGRIPIPFRLRLQEWRSRFGPVFVFLIAAVATTMLWREAVSPAMLVGEVVPIQSAITSPGAAQITSLRVSLHQKVKQGEILADLKPQNSTLSLDVLRQDLTLLRTQSEAATTTLERQDELNYQRLRLAWLEQKVERATSQVRAEYATVQLERAKKLYAEQAASQRDFQLAEQQKLAADVEVKERSQLVEDLGAQIEALKPTQAAVNPVAEAARVQKLLSEHEQRLREVEQSLQHITLLAPIDGIVSRVFRREGENILEGETLLVITATESKEIVGYLRQPFPLEPEVGMRVEVRANNRARSRAMASITAIGAHFQPLYPARTGGTATDERSTLGAGAAIPTEVALPIQISLPTQLALRPGEPVSLVLFPIGHEG